jgi:hypothetical protein
LAGTSTPQTRRTHRRTKDDRKAIAAEGGALSRILDFEFLSRTRSAMQTMRKSALDERLGCCELANILDFMNDVKEERKR